MKPFPFAIWPLQKAPTPSGLSPEEHARLMARFPSSPPTPSIPSAEGRRQWEEDHNAPYHNAMYRHDIDSSYDASHDYRQARPRSGPNDTSQMRSVALRTPSGIHPFVSIMRPSNDDNDPNYTTDAREEQENDYLQDALRNQHMDNDKIRYAIAKHIENAGSLNNGDMFLRLGLLHKNIVDHIADEYVKWHDGGKGPRPDLSKYENPVTRNADGTPWDWRKTAQEAYDLHKNAARYDDYHDYIRHFGGNWGESSFMENMHNINPNFIWDHIDKLVNEKDDGRRWLSENVQKAINLNELRRNGLHTYQYPDIVKMLMRLAIHHQKMTQLHERDSAAEKSFSRGSVQKTNPFPFAVWPNRDNIK